MDVHYALQPEWYFTHILNIAHEQRTFMDDNIQPLLSATEYRHIVAWVRHMIPDACMRLTTFPAARIYQTAPAASLSKATQDNTHAHRSPADFGAHNISGSCV